MAEKSKLQYELKKQLKALKGLKGSGTELISLYITPGYQIADASNKLKEEYGQAANIKSKSTRKNVQAALERIINYLKAYRSPPPNGMAIFAGNVSKDAGRPDIQLFSLEPPEPLRTQFYRCDSAFVLEPLEDIVSIKDTYGLLVMDGREATIATLRGKSTSIVRKLNSTAHSKVRKGGQSARRYERLIEESIEYYYKRIGEALDAVFVGMPHFRGIIVGGPGPAKDDFMKMKPFNYQLKVLGVLDTGYTDEYGVKELVDKSGSILAEQESIKEKQLVDSFIKAVVTGGPVAYGEKEVREALLANRVKTLLVSEGLDLKKVLFRCSQCGREKEVISRSEADFMDECGGKMRAEKSEDVAGELLRIAEEKNTELQVISTETSEGAQFLNSFFGIGAFLKY
ncbi:MAG: peptide chain release factor aRF-1 [Candidatus ainarchaeum sp.]|nr:peptide chain release factor aRF-1 [Candidatus ainarchaeum sp.]